MRGAPCGIADAVASCTLAYWSSTGAKRQQMSPAGSPRARRIVAVCSRILSQRGLGENQLSGILPSPAGQRGASPCRMHLARQSMPFVVAIGMPPSRIKLRGQRKSRDFV